MHSYRELKVWQEGITLAVQIYEVTERFPSAERFGLTQQMRRASVSIPSNVAEGYGRKTARQRYSFLENAQGSLYELETQVELASRIGFLVQCESLSHRMKLLGRALAGLMRYVGEEARRESKHRHA
jgi:four helix bundle protein